MKKSPKKISGDVKSKSNEYSPIKLDFSISSSNIIQWNIQVIGKKNARLVDLIAKEKLDVLCVQETMLSKQTTTDSSKKETQTTEHKEE